MLTSYDQCYLPSNWVFVATCVTDTSNLKKIRKNVALVMADKQNCGQTQKQTYTKVSSCPTATA